MSLEQKLVIAVVAHIGAGKETFGTLLSESVHPLQVKPMPFSGVLKDVLNRIHQPLTRDNFQRLSVALRETFPDFLAHAIRSDIEEAAEPIIILDGPRWPEDIEMIRTLPNNTLVFINTSRKTRYQRVKDRKIAGKTGEHQLSWEEFLAQENAPNEAHIDDFQNQADFVLDNNGTLDDLRKQVDTLWHNHLKSRVA